MVVLHMQQPQRSIGGAFDAPHFTKTRRKEFVTVIPEGPEAGIYVRGTLKDSNID